jgi:hypothetical protein
MSSFALFFRLFGLLRQGRFTVRDVGLSIVLWISDWLQADGDVTEAEFHRMHRWLGWAEWCARRADPKAARKHLRHALARDHSPEALVLRLAAVAKVLLDAPLRTPRRKRKGGLVRALYAVPASRASTAPPTPAPP